MSADPGSPAPRLRLSLAAHAEESYSGILQQLVTDRVASRLFARDATLWGPDAEAEVAVRLGWVDLPEESSSLLGPIAALRAEMLSAGVDRFVLCGMGGSSLAPEVICAAAGVDLEILDSSHPDRVRSVIEHDLARTAIIVSSKSGGTVETDSQRRAFEGAFTEAGLDPASRIVVVTDPDSPLEQLARDSGWRVFLANPDVGGRYSALSAFGLVPSGLAGVNLDHLLTSASEIRPFLGEDSSENPALRLAALMAAAVQDKVDKLVLGETTEHPQGFGAWVEQLVAESTGKHDTGILPIDVTTIAAPNFVDATPDTLLLSHGHGSSLPDAPSGWAAQIDAEIGAQMLLWEAATAVAGRLLGIDPFDQPDVESAKKAARGMLEGSQTEAEPRFVDADVAVFTYGDWLPDSIRTVHEAITHLGQQLDPLRGYLAINAYLDSERDAAVASMRGALASYTARPVSFGWGPRFLHSTGQYHKGGPAQGVFLQVTGAVRTDLAVPDRPFTFGEFIGAQAVGDAQVLSARGCPVLRLHVGRPEALNSVLEPWG